MRKSVIVTLIIIGGALIGLAVAYNPYMKEKFKNLGFANNAKQEAEDLQKAKDLLYNGKPDEALSIIHRHTGEIEKQTEVGQQWMALLIKANVETLNKQQLLLLWEHSPQAFKDNEVASLMVADGLIAGARGKDYQKLREPWKGHETKPEAWFVLDADELLLDGKRKEAIDFLNSHSFQGKADTDRLIRLALLNVLEQPKIAWDYLTLAYTKDPENPDIRSFRAKILETVGKNNLALSEYVAAVQVAPNNIYLKDQLAEFYLRHKQYQSALQVWTENLNAPSIDFIWLKALFWNKMITPVKYDWQAAKIPDGQLKPLVEYILHLPQGQFWDKAAFEKISNGSQYTKTQQATFWLRLLSALKNQNDKEALNLLQYNPFAPVSWDPQLETALRRILQYRVHGSFDTASVSNPLEAHPNDDTQSQAEKNTPPFFAQLQELATSTQPGQSLRIPEDLQSVLTSPEAFTAAFLAAGWAEAAIELHNATVFPSTFPDWVALDYVKALRQNSGNADALDFAHAQKQTPEMVLLIGELDIASNNTDAALTDLAELAKTDTDIGAKAAWMISLIYIDKTKYDEAKEVILNQPRLSKEVLGQETLARIALLEGDVEEADSMYSAIVKDSSEAKSYLARKAFQNKNWKKAKELTEDLLKQYTNNALLRENLKKIEEQQKGE
jgi:thioredoxin-like negative regulator of GroEL